MTISTGENIVLVLRSDILTCDRSASQSGLPLRNIHISNDNGSFTFNVDVFFPRSLPILSPDLTV